MLVIKGGTEKNDNLSTAKQLKYKTDKEPPV